MISSKAIRSVLDGSSKAQIDIDILREGFMNQSRDEEGLCAFDLRLSQPVSLSSDLTEAPGRRRPDLQTSDCNEPRTALQSEPELARSYYLESALQTDLKTCSSLPRTDSQRSFGSDVSLLRSEAEEAKGDIRQPNAPYSNRKAHGTGKSLPWLFD